LACRPLHRLNALDVGFIANWNGEPVTPEQLRKAINARQIIRQQLCEIRRAEDALYLAAHPEDKEFEAALRKVTGDRFDVIMNAAVVPQEETMTQTSAGSDDTTELPPHHSQQQPREDGTGRLRLPRWRYSGNVHPTVRNLK
jgi:hypothetical protein